ncbi:MAG TPA: protein-disulfide reductase DsbD domain-containing protein [Verrucomicrobiae bacterium]
MQTLKRLLPLCCLAVGLLPALAAHTEARLVLSAETARPGSTVMGGLLLRMEDGWHTYWRNPGASGMATEIEWELPDGIAAGEIQWPPPEKYGEDDLTTYVYHEEVVLLVPLTLETNIRPGPLELKAKVSWLECKEACLPGSANVSATLVVGDTLKQSAEAKLIETWQGRLPRAGEALQAIARWEKPAEGASRSLVLEWPAKTGVTVADFFPFSSDKFEVQPATERLPTDAGVVRLRKMVHKVAGDWPAEIAGVLVQKIGAERLAYEVRLPVESGLSATAATGVGRSSQSASTASLWQMLLYAFLGGLILNVMPCVLPVIALKILGFVAQARENPREVRRLGVIYTAGVLASFLALAFIVIALKAAGSKAGWGFQFGNPYFLVAMTTLVTLIALNLFGVFEVTLGGRALETAAQLSSKHGAAGAFFNGLLATVLATSCTAPFLGAAVGFGFAQPPLIIAVTMLTVGLGLAAPYLVLSWQPAWLKFLPKPGLWMERFKVAMGFPMLAAAVWLMSIVAAHYGERTWWLAVFLVFVALAAWIYGTFLQRGANRRGLAGAVLLLLLAIGYTYALESQLRWREPLSPETATGSLQESPDGIAWQRWSPEAVAQARAAGRPVLVDFTAKWCLTCQANKKFALEIPSVRAKLKQINAVALLGDYTRFPADITEELNRFQRAGVPLVLVYPRDATQPPLVLPEALTPGIVLEALKKAATP